MYYILHIYILVTTIHCRSTTLPQSGVATRDSPKLSTGVYTVQSPLAYTLTLFSRDSIQHCTHRLKTIHYSTHLCAEWQTKPSLAAALLSASEMK